jgi:ABC-type branched-subunit amino acid transport system substrate-binding protein
MRVPAFFAVLAALVAACPAPWKPGAPSTPHAGAPAAQGRFDTARARFARDQASAGEFQTIVRDFPDDPIAPYAALYAGMAAHKQGDEAAAAATLAKVERDDKAPDEVRTRARFWLGIADATLGKGAEALPLLEPFDGKVDGDEQVELDAALAEAGMAARKPDVALRHADAFFAHGRPAERVYVAQRVAAFVEGLPADTVATLYASVDRGGPSAAFLGRRVAAALREAGRADAASRVLAESAGARAAVGLPDDAEAGPGGVEPGRVGALLPLSGKRRLVGEAAARGVAMAAGAFDRTEGEGAPLEVAVEDSGDGKGRAAAALDQLAAAGVIGAVGPVDKDAADEAARRAEALALPLITLDVAEAGGGASAPTVFRAVIPVESRARALAAWALAQGARRFAVLAPDLPYGSRARAAFEKEVSAGGGQIVATETYKKDATMFVEPVGRIAEKDFDALFVPDTAARLELIAPQLAVADLVVAPPGRKPPRPAGGKKAKGRPILLVATAEAITPKFLRGSGRYTLGAVLAPGFYPDDTDARSSAYVARYRQAYGDDPTWLDAYAYDAALLLHGAVESGAHDRPGVAAALAAASPAHPVAGLTGDIAFDAAHARADRGRLYTVVVEGAAQAIRVLPTRR